MHAAATRNMKQILLSLLAILSLASCRTSTNLTYFSDLSAVSDAGIPLQTSKITIQPSDELLINVTAPVSEAVAVYNLPFSNPALSDEMLAYNITGERTQTYIVDSEGYIKFPVFGRIHVEGLTTAQLAEELTRRIAEDVESPFVRVELVNFKVKVLGEVSRPGMYKMNTEKVTVLDALAQAGDLTVFAKRDNVVVMRQEGDKLEYHRLDLNDSKSLQSPYYFLHQNDVVYVEPGSARRGQAEYNQNNSYKVSVVSAIVSACSVVASLVIALVINR